MKKYATKSAKSNNPSKMARNRRAWYDMYYELRKIDALCLELNNFDDDEGIRRYENLQRSILITMMKDNVELKIKDKEADLYLQRLVWVLGL